MHSPLQNISPVDFQIILISFQQSLHLHISFQAQQMGNCVVAPAAATTASWDAEECSFTEEDKYGGQRVLKIVRTDGKVLEYSSSLLVRDLLSNFEGFAVGVSRHAAHLPPEHELMTGRVYYLIPKTDEQRGGTNFKRVKVVLTKQQLQELLSQNKNIEEFILRNSSGNDQDDTISCSTSWSPRLETIQEDQ